MDRNTEDRKSELPSKGSQDELEQALKWLEELTSRKGKATEPSSSVPSATIESPFRGLIESDEGDLPDWLREAPSLPNLEGVTETEAESRLDWLAKMAQRESIEELPTLEWRRLGEPMQSALLPPTREGTPDVSDAAIEDEPEQSETVTATEGEPGQSETVTAIEDEPKQSETVTAIEDEPGKPETSIAVEDEPKKPETSTPVKGRSEKLETLAQLTGIPSSDDPLSWLREEDEEMEALIPEAPRDLPASLEIDPQLDLEFDAEDELPSLDDLDAAMAWIEELAASQDAPVEDIPSIVDRALASRLMMEAGASQSVSPLDELGSDSDMVGEFTPTHPFIEEEDFADTVILVETMAAEQGLPVEVPEAIGETETGEFESITILDAEEQEAIIESVIIDEISDLETSADTPSFEEAMALLDEMAAQQEQGPESGVVADVVDLMIVDGIIDDDSEEFTDEAIEAAVESEAVWDEAAGLEDEDAEPETAPVKPFVSDFTPWEDGVEITDSGIVEVITDAEEVSFSTAAQNVTALESTLMSLDALALPAGKTLDDIDASLRVAQIAPVRDVSSALNWLESTLTQETTEAPVSQVELDEEALIARMPEDPDEVLAWLEQMADEEAAVEESRVILEDEPATFTTGDHPAEPLIEELAEADLLDMPEDPDEAMAWLEGLARGGVRASGEGEKIEETGEIEEITAKAVEIEEIGEIAAEIEEVGEIEESAAETVAADVDDIAAVVIPAEGFVADEAPVSEQPATPKPRRRRAKPAKAKVEPAVVEAPAVAEEPAGTEEPAVAEEPVVTPPAKERPDFSWVDLLKPLD